jgi:hypothetical protein
MVSQCANSECGKALHYLRDGKVFLLSVPDASSTKVSSKAEHFWLCGECSTKFDLRQAGSGIEIVPKGRSRRPLAVMADPLSMAS